MCQDVASTLKGMSSLLGRVEEMAAPDVPEPPPTFLQEHLIKRKCQKEEHNEEAKKIMVGFRPG